MRYRTQYPDRRAFFFESQNDLDNAITVFVDDKRITHVSVSDEQAVDSYNSTFECTIALKEKIAIRLRDYLNREFPVS